MLIVKKLAFVGKPDQSVYEIAFRKLWFVCHSHEEDPGAEAMVHWEALTFFRGGVI
jgi:hypothetical protein